MRLCHPLLRPRLPVPAALVALISVSAGTGLVADLAVRLKPEKSDRLSKPGSDAATS